MLPPKTDDVRYPSNDGIATTTHQWLVSEFLRPSLQRFLQQMCDSSLATSEPTLAAMAACEALKARGPFFTGANQLWYWEKGNNQRRVSPDVYVIEKQRPSLCPASWQLWELDTPPLFAFEIACDNFEPDYNPTVHYAATGVQELVVYDSGALVEGDGLGDRERFRWQLWCRNVAGELVASVQTNGDRVKSEALCCWFREVGEGSGRRVHIGLGVDGETLFQQIAAD